MSTSIANLALVDSNILIIAHDRSHPRHVQARSLIIDMLSGQLPVALAHQNLLEWYSVITSANRVQAPLTPARARSVLADLQQSKIHLLFPQATTLTILATLLKEHPVKDGDIYDLYLAATALSYGISTILTENVKDFRRILGVIAINPFREER